MFFLVLVEYLISLYQNKKVYGAKDFWAATTIGIVNVIVNAAIKFGMFAVVLVFYNLVPWYIPHPWWAIIFCFSGVSISMENGECLC
jgi:hypothetical protein